MQCHLFNDHYLNLSINLPDLFMKDDILVHQLLVVTRCFTHIVIPLIKYVLSWPITSRPLIPLSVAVIVDVLPWVSFNVD